MSVVRVATFQTSPNPSNPLEQIQNALERGQLENHHFALFPEGFLTGYFLSHHEAAQVALSTSSVEFARLLEVSRPFKTVLVVGFLERVGETLHNSAAVVARGKLLGVYRKVHPNEKCFTPGLEFPVWRAHGVRFGVNICNDANFPGAARALAQAGAQLIFMPLNNLLPQDVAARWREKSQENLRLRALETGCTVISADVTGTRDNWISYGCSRVVGARGELLGAVPELEEGCVSVTLECAERV